MTEYSNHLLWKLLYYFIFLFKTPSFPHACGANMPTDTNSHISTPANLLAQLLIAHTLNSTRSHQGNLLLPAALSFKTENNSPPSRKLSHITAQIEPNSGCWITWNRITLCPRKSRTPRNTTGRNAIFDAFRWAQLTIELLFLLSNSYLQTTPLPLPFPLPLIFPFIYMYRELPVDCVGSLRESEIETPLFSYSC